MAGKSNLSGAAWWNVNQSKYPNSTSVTDLDAGFKPKVEAFLKALADAGATYTVGSTRRNANLAYLMHYSWKVAKGLIKASAVPKRAGVDIEWDHGNDTASRKGAQEMVSKFQMVHIASLTSRHIEGKAIDVTISWSGTLKIKDQQGKLVEIKSAPRNGSNSELQKIGKGYGVVKRTSDPPHWSTDGK